MSARDRGNLMYRYLFAYLLVVLCKLRTVENKGKGKGACT